MHSNGSARRIWKLSANLGAGASEHKAAALVSAAISSYCVNVLVRLASVKMNTASGSQVPLRLPIARYVLCFLSVLSIFHPMLILEPQQTHPDANYGNLYFWAIFCCTINCWRNKSRSLNKAKCRMFLWRERKCEAHSNVHLGHLHRYVWFN